VPASAIALGTMTRIDAGAILDNGTRRAAAAHTVRLTEALVGPVSAVDPAAGTFTALGQVVAVTSGTAFDAALPGGLAAVAIGHVLAVHGLADADGRITATRVELRASVPVYVVRAPVRAYDTASRRLEFGGGLRVDLALLSPAPPAPAVGERVRVTLAVTPPAPGGAWAGLSLRSESAPPPDRDSAEVEGRVTAFQDARHFSVGGIAVDAGAATVTGSGAIALGTRVEVTGRTVGGVLIARVVEVEDEAGHGGTDGIELEGRITAIDPGTRMLVVRGVTVTWDANTRFEGGTAAQLAVDRKVEVKGQLAPGGTSVLASLIHLEL
jgi:hypothetical protein